MDTLTTYLISLLNFDSSHPLLFTQIHFWLFFLLIYIGFALIVSFTRRGQQHGRQTLRNCYLFLASLLFYYKTSGLFVLLLIFSTLLGWLLGIRMDHTLSAPRRRLQMATGVVLNLLVLFYFKYAYFFTDIYNATIADLFSTSHLQVINHLALWGNALATASGLHSSTQPVFDASVILLPVGISFFTFQNISYIVDVYKRKIPHVANILDFGFYTSFFPQLVAGPILRADQFIPQIYKPYHLPRRQFGLAIFWILNGLVKKLVLSDYLAVNFIDRIFDNPSLYTPFENFASLMLYSLQVYADFSGYTDIAIGVAMLMGFYLPRNFNSPYKAQNPTDFWRRWHISLSHWLRDYLYIPLGGNRSAGFLSYFILAFILAIAAFRLHSTIFAIIATAIMLVLLLALVFFPSRRRSLGTHVNNMDTMLLGGLWHGASFNFITWGGLNGLGILIHKWWHRRGWISHIFILLTTTLTLYFLKIHFPSPLLNLLFFCTAVAFVGFTLLNLLPQTARTTARAWSAWNIFLTFLFISFTRLFFRSGSNLDPAEANEVAWTTASLMIDQIGSHWHLAQIPSIIGHYWLPFLLFALGMAIHWLPTHFKRRYRLWFAQMPLWMLTLITVVAIFLVYQFVTADLQPFIYFQF